MEQIVFKDMRYAESYEHASWFVRNKRKAGIFDTGIEGDFTVVGWKRMKPKTRRIWCNADASEYWVDWHNGTLKLAAYDVTRVEAMQQNRQ